MHSPERLTLPLMVQSGDGATGPDADASRIALAFSGGLIAPRMVVFLLRTRQSHGAMNARCHIPDSRRRAQRALPHPCLGRARAVLVPLVVVRAACGRQRPAVRHQPFLDVLAVGLT